MKKVLLIALLASTQAFAQTSSTSVSTTSENAGTSTIKAGEATKNADRKDIDQEITNAKLRASTGSKSKWSFQSALGYNGGSIEKPFDRTRPMLSASSSVDLLTSIAGDVSVKYRLTDHQNLNAGTGVALVTPGHTGQKSQVQNPYIQWSHVGKLGDLQSIVSASGLYYSQDRARNVSKLDTAVGADHTIMYSVGTTGIDIGANYGASYNFYQDNDTAQDVKGGNTERDDLSLAAFLMAEYAFNDKVSLRTVYRGLEFLHLRGEDFGHFRQTDPTQSFGVGMAVTRDIYLYPNIQWVWGDIRADKTNVALSTNINLF